jgi:prolyl oligopeptidase
MLPFFSSMFGRLWLARGGVLVVANLRGGNEFGPAWHECARRENRQLCYDDVAAVARDLHARKITTPELLAIEGGSNGGLTVAVAALQHPELYRVVLAQCALLDMQNYHKLFCGRSWVDEYGDPDVPADWAFIGRYSPLQNVKPAVEGRLPSILFSSSTRDDRVHPAHSRKMVARMQELGHQEAYLHENVEGGHSNVADLDNKAMVMALEFCFVWHCIAQKK